MLIFIMPLLLLLGGCSNQHPSTEARFLKVAATDDPRSLDPRLVRDLSTVTVMRMLYEGLMRTDGSGAIVPGAAESVSVSDDKRTYTFKLRDASWSDGTPVTAQDFAETWRSILNPAFPAPNAYQLYLIKGAKDAKEGKSSLDNIGVKTTDSQTLIVELNQPAPYFLEMTSCHFFFPVHQSLRQSPPNTQIDTIIGNGPFTQNAWNRRNAFTAVKNPHYWDASHVNISGVELIILDENTALQLYKAGAIDWAGSPLSTLPQDAVSSLKQQNQLKIAPGAGTHIFRINTTRVPFDNEKMRRAFALAIDRQAIVDHVTQGNQLPAIGFVPPSFGFSDQNYYQDHDVAKAQQLFKGALAEMHQNKKNLPRIALRYAANDRNHKIAQAVQQQWSKAFDIPIALESTELQVYFDKVRTGDYHLAMASWYADIRDPINFLELFKSKENPTNQTFWESSAYTQLLENSSLEMDPAARTKLLQEAEKMLLTAMPVAPIFHSSYNYLKSDQVQGVYFSPLGFLDFKEASL